MKLGTALSFLAILVLAGCKKETEEDRIRAVIAKAIESANKKSASGVVEDAADSFLGPQNLKKNECKTMIAGFLFGAGWVHVFERNLAVTLGGDTKAHAVLQAVLARGQEVKKIEDVLPTNAAEFRFNLDLEKIDGKWRFVKATYEQK